MAMVHEFVVHKFVYLVVFAYLCTSKRQISPLLWKKHLFTACQSGVSTLLIG